MCVCVRGGELERGEREREEGGCREKDPQRRMRETAEGERERALEG